MSEVVEKCPSCNKKLLDDSEQLYCQECGFPVDTLRCVECKAEIEETFKHCPKCGTDTAQ